MANAVECISILWVPATLNYIKWKLNQLNLCDSYMELSIPLSLSLSFSLFLLQTYYKLYLVASE